MPRSSIVLPLLAAARAPAPAPAADAAPATPAALAALAALAATPAAATLLLILLTRQEGTPSREQDKDGGDDSTKNTNATTINTLTQPQ